jgi:BA14K-like protein
MSHLRLLGAVAILATAMASPVLAQAVISEPGYCAFFYPNANCQNRGPGNPYTDSNYQRSQGMYAYTGSEANACARYRSYDPASGTYIGRNGRRVACR